MACAQHAERAPTLFNYLPQDATYSFELGHELPGTMIQTQCPHRQPGKRPRHVPATVISIEDHEDNDTMALQYIALFAKWVRGLRQAHQNCLNIPVPLVIKMGVRMTHHLVLKKGIKMRTETLAATFWVALKFYSSRDTIPNASFMSLVTGVGKNALLGIEPKVLGHLGWDLYSFYQDE